MSHLFIRSLGQIQAARSLTSRLLSTSSVLNIRVNSIAKYNDPNEAEFIRAHQIIDVSHPIEFDIKSNELKTLLSDPLLLTDETARPIKVESTGTKPLEDERGKVLTAKDVVVDKDNKASLDQLNEVADHLARHLPHFFTSPHPFKLYSKDVVFIDKTRSIRTQGINPYTLQIALVKIYYSISYTSNKLELLNLVKDQEESTIKIRWRFVSKPGLLKFMLTFYKFHGSEIWKDAISTFHINKEGKIYCHLCDNIDVEKEGAKLKKVVKNQLVDRGISV